MSYKYIRFGESVALFHFQGEGFDPYLKKPVSQNAFAIGYQDIKIAAVFVFLSLSSIHFFRGGVTRPILYISPPRGLV